MRGVAVTLVVAYHAGVGILTGGFVGVDDHHLPVDFVESLGPELSKRLELTIPRTP